MKNVFLLVLLFSFQVVQAEKIIFNDDINNSADITGDAQINFQTGDISVTTDGDYTIIDNTNEPVILGFYPSDYDVGIGTSITVNWTVAYAASCSATTTSGATTWAGVKSSATGNNSESSVTVTQLPATLRMECSNAGGAPVARTFTITQQSTGGGGSPTIEFFTVDNQSTSAVVNAPGTATIDWDTQNVSSCTATSTGNVTNWAGSVGTSGPRTVTFSGNTTVTLTCDSTVNRSVAVTYNENSSCTNSVFPSGLSRVSETYAENNDNAPFGTSTNVDFELSLNTNQFATLSGVQVPSNFRRRIGLVSPPTQQFIDQGTISVSECPGDFTVSGAACIINVTNNSEFRISSRPADASDSRYCVLDPTKTYWFNYVTSPDPYNQPPTCQGGGTRCTFFYKENALAGPQPQ